MGEFLLTILLASFRFHQIFCQFTTSKEKLISKVFPNFDANYKNHACLSKRAILSAKNKNVDNLNTKIPSHINGQIHSFKWIDSITDPNEVVNYPTEFLNPLDLPGLPPHNIQLKVGSVLIMLRNFNQPKLCNAPRLAVKKLLNILLKLL